MLQLINEPGINVYAITFAEFQNLQNQPAPEGCRYAFVKTNDESFGYPIWLPRWFLVVYHASRKFNLEAMKLPETKPTIAEALEVAAKQDVYRESYVAPHYMNANACISTRFLKPGWKSSYWLGLDAESFSKLPPAAETCKSWRRHIHRSHANGVITCDLEDLHVWLHPSEHRALYKHEVAAITGQPTVWCTFDAILDGLWIKPPERVRLWLQRNVGFYTRNAWASHKDLEAKYVRQQGNPKGQGFETPEVTTGTKYFDFGRYYVLE